MPATRSIVSLGIGLIGILGIGSFILSPLFAPNHHSDGPTRIQADINALETALISYQMKTGMLPTTEQGLRSLLEKPSIAPIPESWSQMVGRLPLDRWDRLYQYKKPGTRNPHDFDLFSLGEDGIASADDIGNWPAPESYTP